LTRENVRAIRPGFGIATKYLPDVLGRAVKQDVKRGTALRWDLL
ncbi:MAG: SAF domain-containing protein, partial [Steroidobacteraceae bacterium]